MTTSYSPLWSCTGRDGCQSALWDCFGGQIFAMLKIRPPKQSHNALDNHLDPVFRKTSKRPIYMLHYSHYFCYLIFLTLRYPTSYSGYRNLCKTDTWFLSLGDLLRTFDHFTTKWPLEDFNNQKYKTHLHALAFSDFVKGEFWDSSSEKWVPVQNKWVPVNESEIENTLGLYVTRQLVWRQTPKLCNSV